MSLSLCTAPPKRALWGFHQRWHLGSCAKHRGCHSSWTRGCQRSARDPMCPFHALYRTCAASGATENKSWISAARGLGAGLFLLCLVQLQSGAALEPRTVQLLTPGGLGSPGSVKTPEVWAGVEAAVLTENSISRNQEPLAITSPTSQLLPSLTPHTGISFYTGG